MLKIMGLFNRKTKILELEIKNLKSMVKTYENRLIAIESTVHQLKKKANTTKPKKKNDKGRNNTRSKEL
jgi:hypothetical protein